MESVTKQEYETASKKDIPCYILIETNVYAEYRTYLRNKENSKVNYAHVDSINIFRFMEDILTRPRNNPIFCFEKFSQIEEWLRIQWAGIFREMLNRKSQHSQIKTLAAEITGLQEVNKTLKRYLEALMSGLDKKDSDKLIKTEEKRLKEIDIKNLINSNSFFDFINRILDLTVDEYIDVQETTRTFDEFIEKLNLIKKGFDYEVIERIKSTLINYEDAREHLNYTRGILGLAPFSGKPSK